MRITLAACSILLAACGSPRPRAADSDSPPSVPASLDAGHVDWPGRPTRSCLPEESSESLADAGPQPRPKVVSGHELQRISGNSPIEPDPNDRPSLLSGGKTLSAVVKFCVDTAGRVSSVKLRQSSGRSGYDEKIKREMSCWTYRPVMIDGQPTAVCSIMVFLYRNSTAASSPR